MHVVELNRMGASITAEGRSAVVDGPAKLTGCQVRQRIYVQGQQ